MPKSWPMCTDMSLLLEPQMRLSDRAVGSGPAASDRRVRLYRAWLCRAGPGLGCVPLNFAGTRRARTASDGMADDPG